MAEDEALDEDYKQRIEQDLLFLTQGVGSIKSINNFDVYVKHDQCEYSLKDIYRRLKTESEKIPIIKLTLGNWQFLAKDLIPLLIFHRKDKKLSFLTCMLLVQLTEIPVKGETGLTADSFEKSWVNPKNEYRHSMMEILREYKEAFLQPDVITVLMEHLADCLQIEVRNDKHDQMIELIIVLFKNLLQIPEPRATQTTSAFVGKDL